MCLKLQCEPSVSSFNYAISINELQRSEDNWRNLHIRVTRHTLIDRLKLGKYFKPTPSQALISLARSTFNVNCDSIQPTWEWRMIYWKLNWWLFRGLLKSKIDKRLNRLIGQSIKSWRRIVQGNYIQLWKKTRRKQKFSFINIVWDKALNKKHK